MSDLVQRAKDLAHRAHAGQVDKAERLAEALREVDKQLDDVEPYADARAVERCHETIRAALDQERKDG